jgi:hypothetical protein
MPWHQGLGPRILAWMLPTALVVVIGTLSFSGWTNYQRQFSALETRAEVTSKLQASALALPMWNLDDRQVEATIRAMAEDPDFVSATVTLPDGRSYFQHQPHGEGGGRVVERTHRITFVEAGRTHVLGDLKLELATTSLETFVDYAILVALASSFLLILTLGGAQFLVLNAMVFHPLRLMREAMGRVKRSEWTRVNWHSTGELAMVVDSFNDMVDSLRDGEAAKKQLHENEERYARARAEEARAEAASRAKSEFLAHMSHELRTPLNAIIGYTSLMMEDARDAGHELYLPDLDNIQKAGKHLLSLINNVLDLSKIEAGRMEVHAQSFDIAEMVHEVSAVVSQLVARNDNALIVDCPAGIGVMTSDLTKLRQSLLNLLGNAAKFTHNGTVRLSVSRSFDPGARVPMVSFEVRDTGIGMTEEQVERLFKPFSQADAAIQTRYGGTGLGLALTYSFAEMLGGSIAVRSQTGVGSTFTLRVPEAFDAPPVEEPADLATPAPAPSLQPKVLVIDDDRQLHDMVEHWLTREGFTVVHAHGGPEGIDAARDVRPDLILLDVIMPSVDGWTVLGSLQSDPGLRHIPVVLLSVTGQRDLGLMLGAVEFLVKPLDSARLLASVRRFLGDQQSGVVLVVDDVEGDRAFLSRTLRRAGVPTIEAANGAQAMEVVERLKPSVVLLDLTMPVMDGFAFMAEVSRRPDLQDIPIIIVTARELSDAERRQLDREVSAVLSKGGFTSDELLALVRARIRNEQAQILPELAGV